MILEFSPVKPEYIFTKTRYGSNLMRNKKNGSTTFAYVLHLAYTFLLELSVTYRQHFIHDQNFRFQMCGHGKCQSHIHAAAITFDRRVYVAFHFGKGDNLIKLFVNLVLAHSRMEPFR